MTCPFYVEYKQRYFQELFFPYNESQNNIRPHWLSLWRQKKKRENFSKYICLY